MRNLYTGNNRAKINKLLDEIVLLKDELVIRDKQIDELNLKLSESYHDLKKACLLNEGEKKALEEQVIVFGTSDLEIPEPQEFALEGLIPKNKLSIVAAEGGIGKSTVLTALAFHMVTGRTFLGLETDASTVLYVDFELDKEDFTRRAIAISNGMNLKGTVPFGIRYWKPEKSLASQEFIADLKALIESHFVDVVIIDSISMGSIGADMVSSVDTISILQRLSRLNCTVIGIDHVSHQNRGAGPKAVPFGSVFKLNSARSVITFSKEKNGIVLHHTKANFSALKNDAAFCLEWSSDESLLMGGKNNVVKVSSERIEEVRADPKKELVSLVEKYIKETNSHPTRKDIAQLMSWDGSDKTIERKINTLSKPREEAVRDMGKWSGLYHYKDLKDNKTYRYTTYRMIGADDSDDTK